jgi:hypothetical protein
MSTLGYKSIKRLKNLKIERLKKQSFSPLIFKYFEPEAHQPPAENSFPDIHKYPGLNLTSPKYLRQEFLIIKGVLKCIKGYLEERFNIFCCSVNFIQPCSHAIMRRMDAWMHECMEE